MVRTGQGDSNRFDVKVVVRQSLVFSHLLFAIVIDIATKTARGEMPWELLYIDILVLTATTKEELRRKLYNDARARTEDERRKSKMTYSIGQRCKSMLHGHVDSVARVPIISLERTKWVHKGCSGMKGRLQVVSARIVMQYMSGRGTTCGGEGRGPGGGWKDLQHSRPILPNVRDLPISKDGVDAATTSRVRCAWLKFRE